MLSWVGRWRPVLLSMQAGWRFVGLEKSAGARCARFGTAVRVELRDGRQCGPLGGAGGGAR